MIWSILIAGIPERYHTVQPLLYSLLELQNVSRMPDVELLYLMDNKRQTVGEKRNALLAASNGEYISFIDDDDEVSPDYVDKIYRQIVASRKIDPQPDVICFPQRASILPAGFTHECSYSIRHWKDRKPGDRRAIVHAVDDKEVIIPGVFWWSGPPAHTMVWRWETIKDVKFPEKNFQEDTDFVDLACEKAQTEIALSGEPLYFYKFNEETSATR